MSLIPDLADVSDETLLSGRTEILRDLSSLMTRDNNTSDGAMSAGNLNL